MNFTKLSLPDLAIAISDYLRKNNINAILTGGACVSVYTQNRFMSEDIDFVLISDDEQPKVKELLEKVGFQFKNGFFRHDKVRYTIEFLAPPPSIGSDPVKNVKEIMKDGKTLTILSPTDCVKDRLAAFYHWGDRPSLEQAIMVCRDNPVDLKEVERWSRREGMIRKYDQFIKTLEQSN